MRAAVKGWGGCGSISIRCRCGWNAPGKGWLIPAQGTLDPRVVAVWPSRLPCGCRRLRIGDHHRHVPAAPSTLVRTLQTIPAQSKVTRLCTKLRNRESLDL